MGVTILPKKFYDAKNEQNKLLQQIATSLGVTAGNLQDAINIANQASLNAQNKITELNENWNLLTTAQQQDAEVVTARQSTVKNKTFASLDARLEAAEQDLSVHQADITAHNRTLTHLTYYVNADTGNDNNQGTSGAPFKTIKKAIDSIPVGAVGYVRLLGGTAFSIDTSIYVYNKVVALGGWGGSALINITSPIFLTDSTFSVSRINMYSVISSGDSAIFYCSGIVGIKCGGYDSFNVRPLQETSNVNFIYVSAAAMGDNFFTRPVAIYLIGDRTHFRTDNYPSYSGTFNVFAKDSNYTFPVVFTRWWQMTKDANVNWGATEYQLGSSGTSLWYF